MIALRGTPISILHRQGGRNNFGPLAFTLLLLVLVTVFSGHTAFGAAKNVNFASNTPTLSGTLPLIVAQEFGFFGAEGLDVKTVFIRGGHTAMARHSNRYASGDLHARLKFLARMLERLYAPTTERLNSEPG